MPGVISLTAVYLQYYKVVYLFKKWMVYVQSSTDEHAPCYKQLNGGRLNTSKDLSQNADA